MAKLVYKDVEINLQEGVAPQTALEALKSIYPELGNATLSVKANGDFEAVVATATKGATGRFAIYGDNKIMLNDAVTPEIAKSTLSQIFPEVANSTMSIDAAGNFVFTVATATKGVQA